MSESEIQAMFSQLTPEQRQKFIAYLKETLNNRLRSDVQSPIVALTN